MLKKILHRRGWSWYAAKTPNWLIWYYKKLMWRVPANEKVVYLTFDDGPIPIVTEFVLTILKHYNVKAHFFCIGKNVQVNKFIYNRIINEGHRVGNHTFNHLNGWKTNVSDYLNNINEASKLIQSNLFRPPYGRIKKAQIKKIINDNLKNEKSQLSNSFNIVMWDVLSGDFDQSISTEKCYNNVIKNVQNGSIIVFHDSIKAFDNMKKTLPKVIEWLQKEHYTIALLP